LMIMAVFGWRYPPPRHWSDEPEAEA
jgi:hypothetical protein